MKIEILFGILLIIHIGGGIFNTKSNSKQTECHFKFEGDVDDCNCTFVYIDSFNNYKLQPLINYLLRKNYFRFFKVNLHKICQFWPDDTRCSIKDCSVKTCDDDDLPESFKKNLKAIHYEHVKKDKITFEALSDSNNCESSNPLGHLNQTLREEDKNLFEDWKKYDNAQDNFCELDDESMENAQYYDLLINPERYTGYTAPHAHKIWSSIYKENCFPISKPQNYLNTHVPDECLEKRVFYRLISGLHASINIHLSARHNQRGHLNQEDKWGPSVDEFLLKFGKTQTNGEGEKWLRNLYFIYLVELRALAKAAPYLEREMYYTGNVDDDEDTQSTVKELLKIIKSFRNHFDESKLFRDEQAQALKTEVQLKFRNITRIMDCVGCEKCRLWGKLQTTALGTALKILFSNRLLDTMSAQTKFQLTRTEIFALFNGFGRLSTSLVELDNFRHLLTTNAHTKPLNKNEL